MRERSQTTIAPAAAAESPAANGTLAASLLSQKMLDDSSRAAIEARFRVRIVWPEHGLLSRTAHGWSQDYDETSIRVQTTVPPMAGTKVRLHFHAPESMTLLQSGMSCEMPATVRKVRRIKNAYQIEFEWDNPLSELLVQASQWRRKKLGLVLVAVIAASLWLARGSFAYFWYDPLIYLYSSMVTLYFFSRFLLSLAHRPPTMTGYEPTVSVVICVHNDEKVIASSARSCWSADYPSAKREIIVVDDGSTDGTPKLLDELKREIPEIQVLTIPHSGKRHAMAKAFRQAKGELIVVMDSDSVLDRNALRHIVCGFEDPTLGAVSGWTGVTNADQNLLTKMQEIRYLVSFELMKTSESLFGAVTCCPGCLSAYRRKYLMEIIDDWLHQTFLGVPSTFGDDRSLTNFILRNYRAIYNPLARSTTMVPDNWSWYLRQQCRWKKSWLREAPKASRILLRKHPVAAISFYVGGVCSLLSPAIAFRFLWDRGFFVPYIEGMAMLSVLTALFALWKKPTKHWWTSWYWIFTQVLITGPQTYYALLTLRKSHWGTR